MTKAAIPVAGDRPPATGGAGLTLYYEVLDTSCDAREGRMGTDIVGAGAGFLGFFAESGMVSLAIFVSASIGLAGVGIAAWSAKGRKKDAAEDRKQRGRIAKDQLAVASRQADIAARQADIAAQAVTEAAADRKDQLAVASRQADIAAQAVTEAAADRKQQAAIEARRTKEADGTLKALTELLHRSKPPSPPGVADPKPDNPDGPNPSLPVAGGRSSVAGERRPERRTRTGS